MQKSNQQTLLLRRVRLECSATHADGDANPVHREYKYLYMLRDFKLGPKILVLYVLVLGTAE